MKKKLLSILLCLVMVVGLLPTAVLAAGEVAIDEANFPDANFRSYVKNEFDTDKNDKLSSAEIATVKKIEANNKGIKSLKGVGFFTALETLNCWDNELTGLDLSKNTALKELQCSNSKLQSLDLSQNTNLTYLYCGRNPLTTLDLSKNAKLKVLNCSGFGNKNMELTELDLSQNTALESLDCSLNKLKELNVSGCTALVKLDCGGNQLDALDVSKNKNLIELLCSSNQLEALDVSKNTKLEKLYCRDNFLAELDVSKNLELKSISYGKNGLTSLDLDKNEKITDVNSDNQQFYNKDTLPAGGPFDMKTLPGFDPKRAIDWQGGTMDETTGILTVDADAEAVTYNYKTKSDSTDAKYLMPCKMEVRGGTTPPTTYTVSFNANGGSGTMTAATGISGNYTLPANGFTAPADQQFKGWATSASGAVITGTSINVTENTTLYAIWEPIPVTTYTVSFDANGGTGTMPDVTGVSGEYTLPANGFTAPSGKQFKGWATSASGTVITGTSITVTADTKLYAIWTYTSSGGYYYAPTAAVVPDMPMLYRGCTGDAVKTLQDKLNALGYNSGNVDGIFGAKTYAAVTAFQKANSLGVDGIVGKLTWGKLYGISPAMPVETTTVVGRPMVSYGSRGDAVRKLQELLNALGYDCGSVDGIFGSKTKAAVLAFQKANGLGADGIVGPLTWAKLG